MCFVETNVQEEGLLGNLFEKANSRRRNIGYFDGLCRHDLVVANHGRIFRDVLNTNESRAVTVRPQPMKQVLAVVVQREARDVQARASRSCVGIARSATRLGSVST